MDHLPPHPINRDPIRVPLLCSPDLVFEPGDFSRLVNEIPLDRLKNLKEPLYSSSAALIDEWAPRLQGCLYFALLSATLQLPVSVSDFALVLSDLATQAPLSRSRKLRGYLRKWRALVFPDSRNQASFLTTRKLRGYLHKWRGDHEVAIHNPSLLAGRRKQSITILDATRTAYLSFAQPQTVFGGPEIDCGFLILVYTLYHALCSVSSLPRGEYHVEWIPWREVRWISEELRCHFIEERLIRQGWCPAMIDRFWETTNASMSLYYLSLYDSPRIREHQGCRELKTCKSLSIGQIDYQTKHTDQCHGCDFLSFDLRALRSIVDKGRIPVLQFSQDEKEPN